MSLKGVLPAEALQTPADHLVPLVQIWLRPRRERDRARLGHGYPTADPLLVAVFGLVRFDMAHQVGLAAARGLEVAHGADAPVDAALALFARDVRLLVARTRAAAAGAPRRALHGRGVAAAGAARGGGRARAGVVWAVASWAGGRPGGVLAVAPVPIVLVGVLGGGVAG